MLPRKEINRRNYLFTALEVGLHKKKVLRIHRKKLTEYNKKNPLKLLNNLLKAITNQRSLKRIPQKKAGGKSHLKV
jgi:hypothetical protein